MDRSKWEYKKLGDLCSKLTDGSHNPPKGIENSDYRMISSQNIFNDKIVLNDYRYLSKEDFETEDKRTALKKGDLLLTIVGAIGRCYVLNGTEGNLTLQRSVAALTPKDTISSRFLMYYFIGNNANLLEEAHGAAQKGIYLRQLSNLIVPVPTLDDQQRIVAELDCLNEMIALKQEQLKEFDKLAQSIFYDMFGDPITNEKGWKDGKMGEFCTISSSKRIFANEYCEEGVPFYRGKEITELSKGFPISVELNISQSRYEEIKRDYGIPSIGDILITAVGTIGNIWVVNDNSPFYFKDGNIVWVKDIKGFDTIYFKTILTILISAYKHEMAQGCAYNALTIVNLKKLKVLLPPLALQQQFAEKIQAIEAQKELVKQSIAETQHLLDSRMDYYFD